MARRARGEPDLPPGPAQDLVNLYRRLRAVDSLGVGQVATRTGLAKGHVSDVLAGWRAPSPDTAERIAEAMRAGPADARKARVLAERLHDLNRHQRQRASRPASAHSPDRVQTRASTLDPVPAPAGPRFRVLGPVRTPVDVGGATARAVLAALLVRGDLGARTEDLVAWVWGGAGETSRGSVYRYISSLRTALAGVPGVALTTRRAPYRLTVDPDDVDWHHFQRLVGQGRQAREAGRPEDAATLLRQALALWQGDPLSDLGDRLPGFRRRMALARRDAAEALAECANDPAAVLELRKILLQAPLREHSVALVVDALAALGRRDDAGELFRLARVRLAEERGLEPSAELAAAHKRVLTGQPVASVHEEPAVRPISGLPRTDLHFTGRTGALFAVISALRDGRGRPCVVYGMGGIGKTALAIRAAAALREQYPDGTVFLDLRGWSDGPPLDPADALDHLLRRLRIDGGLIPSDRDERIAFYRDRVADRRLLLILDNAQDTAQLRPLLPADGLTGVLITSRSRLTALDDAVAVPLDLLAHDEAASLFRSIAGAETEEIGAERTISRIVTHCGLLPLAVRIAASRCRGRGSQALTSLEAELSDASSALNALQDDERSVTATLRVSMAHLPAEATRTLRLIGGHPGNDFDSYAVAALAGLSLSESARWLDALMDANLLLELVPGRYLLHDLVQAFARDLPAEGDEPVLARLAEYYLESAEQADRVVTPERYRPSRVRPGSPPAVPSFPDYQAAFTWLTVEQTNVAAVCVAAGAAGLDETCWQLAFTLRGYYFITKNWHSWLETHEAALASARRLGDHRAEALIDNIGRARLEQSRPDEAAMMFEQARQLFAAEGDEHGETTERSNLAWLAYADGEYAQFLEQSRPVLEFYRRTGAMRNAAITLRGVGLAKTGLGRTAEAVSDLIAALEVFEQGGLWLYAAMTWNALGENWQRRRAYGEARRAFDAALASSERAGTVFERARAWQRLGEIASDEGDPVTARQQLALALAAYRALGAPEAARVERAIRSLEDGFQVE
jgi:DNA-binding SARP family transcriptional activator